MRIADLLRTPRSPHVFAVTEEAIFYASLDRKRSRLERLERWDLPADTVQVGPVGLFQVKTERLKAGLETLKRNLEQWPKRACLVVPDVWLRTVLLALEALPRHRQEAEEVIRWRLKKLLPCRPEEVRLDYVSCGTNGQVLVMLGLDKPISLLEEAFAAHGCHLGSIEPVSMAVAGVLPASPHPMLLFSAVRLAMTLVVVEMGQVRLTRLKLLPKGETRANALVLRELSRTEQLLRQKGIGEEGFSVVIGECGETLAQAVQLWALEQKGVEVRRLGDPPGLSSNPVGPLLAWGLLAAAQPGEAA